MDELELTTVVYVPPEELFEFLLDFPGYADYTEYLREVREHGDGGVGTRYDMVLSWWKLTYTAASRVTGVERPERIDWEVVKDVDARGCWRIEEVPGEAPDDRETASRVFLEAEFSPDSVHAASSSLNLPWFVSVDWLIRKAKPLAVQEAERVLERAVADLEGEPRDVSLELRTRPELL